MERKIGEIFEHDGEWYQCIKSTDDTCMNCDMNFDGKCPIPLKECEESGRSDKSYVIFKKLKPVGDPFACNYFGDKSPLVAQKYRLHHMPAILPDIPHVYSDDGNETTVAIEIKQDKKDEKDMEENKNNTGNCSECGDSRLEVIARAKEDLFKSTNIESNEEEMAVLDNILFRCYQMGWLDRYEEKEPNLKEFDLEAAKAGKPVCTRDGRKARIICFDKKDEDNIYPIVCLVQDGETESLGIFMKDGHSLVGEEETPSDLMMLPEKHEGWVNVYKASIGYESGKIYDSKEKAVQSANPNCIATVKIQWEE